VDDAHWQKSVRDFLQVVEKNGDDSLRRDVWWALHDQAESLQLRSPVSQQKVLFLLVPIEPHHTQNILRSIITDVALQRWSAETNGLEHADIRERLRRHCEIPATSSTLKRKRADLPNEVIEVLRDLMPGVPIDADFVENLPQALNE
jgi:hypothetical protein